MEAFDGWINPSIKTLPRKKVSSSSFRLSPGNWLVAFLSCNGGNLKLDNSCSMQTQPTPNQGTEVKKSIAFVAKQLEAFGVSTISPECLRLGKFNGAVVSILENQVFLIFKISRLPPANLFLVSCFCFIRRTVFGGHCTTL